MVGFCHLSTLLAVFACGIRIHAQATNASSTNVTLIWKSPVYTWLFEYPLPIPPKKTPLLTETNPTNGAPIDYYEVDIKPFYRQMYPNKNKTRLVGYDGMSPGPTFLVERGREAVVRFLNHADRNNSVHLHGAWTRAPWDGWAYSLSQHGEYKDHYYSSGQTARTLFYHDHAVMHTSENVVFGQAGLWIIEDSAESSLDLPTGDYDIPLSIMAKYYNDDGSLWSPDANNEMVSLFGDVIEVNGQPWPYLNVEPRKYRFRTLNGGISRDYILSFSADDDSAQSQIPFQVIASDSGLLRSPVETTTLGAAVSERWEIVIDFAAYEGRNITLHNDIAHAFYDNFVDTDKIMRFVVGEKVSSSANNGPVPSALRSIEKLRNPSVQRNFTWEITGSLWTINGHAWEDAANRIVARPQLGATETWQLINHSPASHPVHIHLVDFDVISRTGGRNAVLPYEQAGQKDVVWLDPGETVVVEATFQPWDGVYMFHCHNSIHEDHSMMAAFNVTTLQSLNYTEPPRLADPMDPRFGSNAFSDADWQARRGDFSPGEIRERLRYFASLHAYTNPYKVEEELQDLWKSKVDGGIN